MQLRRRITSGPQILRLACPLALCLVAIALAVTTHRLEAYTKSPYPVLPTPRYNPVLAARLVQPDAATELLDRARIPVEFELLRGETVSQVFQKLGLEPSEARTATDALAEHVDFRTLRAGNQYSAFFNPDTTLASFELTLAGSGRVAMTRRGDRWATTWQPFERSVSLRVLRGSLDGSLEASIRQAGGPPALAYRMADVLQWDLDFTRDLQRGDRFELLYEEVLLDGRYYDMGDVVALAYENQGRRFEAYRFEERDTYYDGEGRPLKKMFLRSPMKYSQITSRFSHRRFHPVLKKYRPHYGVDYGAPVGTPARVTANGTVESAGWDRGGGNVVRVRHAGGYMTAYLHLSRFAKGIRRGARVRQGDVIGYVGATGLATGPHLDYRVKYRDQWIDPLSLKGVRDEPIPASRLGAFRAWRDGLRAGMQTGVPPRDLLQPDRAAVQTQLASGRGAARSNPAGATAR